MRFMRPVAEWLVVIAIAAVAVGLGVWFASSELGADFYDRWWWVIAVLFLVDLVISAVVLIRRMWKWFGSWWWFWKDEFIFATIGGLCFYVCWTSRGRSLVLDVSREWSESTIAWALPFVLMYGSMAATTVWKAWSTERRRMREIEAAQKPLPSSEPDRSLLARSGLIQ